MPNVISNSSCLITLDNIGMMFILRELYGRIYITEEVFDEFGRSLADWIEIKEVSDRKYLQMLNNLIDLGEASTIALSLEIEDSLMILDDRKARKVAQNLDLKFTGLLGVILKAKQEGIINSVRAVLEKLKSAKFRISEAMEKEVLRLADEQLIHCP